MAAVRVFETYWEGDEETRTPLYVHYTYWPGHMATELEPAEPPTVEIEKITTPGGHRPEVVFNDWDEETAMQVLEDRILEHLLSARY